MTEAVYKVKTERFEGPLDLLLSLVEKRKLHINDVSLSKITDDYMEHVKQFEHFPIGDTANFILVASILLLIKSKSLLPTLNLTTEEELGIDELERRLKMYQKIKDSSIIIKKIFGQHIIFFKSQSRFITPVFTPDTYTNTLNLLVAVKDVLKNFPKKEAIPKAVVQKVISLEDMIGNLTERVKSSLKMSFKEFSKFGKEEKVHVIVSFLAMLELVKQGVIMVSQEEKFDDITIETQDFTTPRYG